MAQAPGHYLNPREQQIMEILYQKEPVSAADVQAALPGAPSNSTVRTLLRVLESKGLVTHVEKEGRFLYHPVRPRVSAARSALDRVLGTFFNGSLEQAFATLLSDKERQLSAEEWDRLARMIEEARAAEDNTAEEKKG